MDNYLNQYGQNNTSQTFVCFVQTGKIFNSYGQQVGVTNDEYNKAIETAKGFQNKLIEAGILSKPKTAEEINRELQDTLKQTQSMMAEMSNTIVSLNQKVNKLEGEQADVQQAVNNANGKQVSRK